MNVLVGILIGIVAITCAVLALIYLLVPLFKGLGWLVVNTARGVAWIVTHIFRFVAGMIGDLFRAIGALVTAVVFVPLVLLNVVIGRWSASAHYGRGLQDEIKTFGACVYRFVIGHPARFLLMGGMVEGIEQRLPQAMAEAPGSDKPSRRTGQFDGYSIVGSLQGGGSGGRLYVANPDERKRAVFARNGQTVDQVVIKSFSLQDGSSLPQIIRESRALEAAKKMGLVLDHELNDSRFFYVMPYVPGDSLTAVTRRMHAEAGPKGLDKSRLDAAMAHIADLLGELSQYHHGGLWHKDVKPDNIIISEGRAKLVDLGLVTPLRSAMTLTTHGTEYFRDPEMVRMALRGAKVREVDGVKFDLFGVGAVLYSVVEGQFPAHGGLSQISKNCPEALRWIVRRAMTELHNRYASADEMLADLRAVMAAPDPFALKAKDLPSVQGGEAMAEAVAAAEREAKDAAEAFGPAPAGAATAEAADGVPADFRGIHWGIGGESGKKRATPSPFGPRRRPRLQVTDWLTGRYIAVDRPMPGGGEFVRPAADQGSARRSPRPFGGKRPSASEQLQSAQERLRRAQGRVSARVRRGPARFSAQPNAGVFAAVILLLSIVGLALIIGGSLASKRGNARVASDERPLTIQIGSNTLTISSKGITTAQGELPDLEALNQLGERLTEKVQPLLARAAASAPVRDAAGGFADGFKSGSVSVVEATSLLPGSAGSVLLLDLLPRDTVVQDAEALDGALRSLRRRGYEVLGRGDSSKERDLLAQGRRAVELGHPDDPEAVQRVQHWLNHAAEGPEAVLWLGASAGGGAPVVRLVIREGTDREAILGAMQE